jgi:hypothetical protein
VPGAFNNTGAAQNNTGAAQNNTGAEGKYLSCYARWQNETGHLGKPSAIQHIAIS